jgi:DNA-binding NtrC family response regulator
LLITDLVMPEQDGLQVIREVHKKLPNVKIIAMSGGGRLVSRDYLVVASKIGANEILDKPFTFDQLQETLKKVL